MAVTPQHRILLVDDDPGLRDLLSAYLTSQGFSVTAAGSVAEMDAASAETRFDLVVLDLMLPDGDGLQVLRTAGRAGPVIMVSARGDDVDRIVGLEMGADDYLGKPFNPRELVARIRAVLRRPRTPTTARVLIGPLVYDLESYRLMDGDEEIKLSTAERELLDVFVSRPNRPLSRDQLVGLLSGGDRSPFDRSVDVRVTRLRKKLRDEGTPRYIRTVWGVGYMFTPGGEAP